MTKNKTKILGPFTSVYPFYRNDVGDSRHNFYVLEQDQKNETFFVALYIMTGLSSIVSMTR